MAGKPQRKNPKRPVQVYIDESVYQSILPLLDAGRIMFYSVSQLIETIIFMSEHMYIESKDDSFIVSLAELKSRRTIEQVKGHVVEHRRVHATLDTQAIAFIDMLVRKYKMLFRNRSEVMELLLSSVGDACKTPEMIGYYRNRLNEVLARHPLVQRQAPSGKSRYSFSARFL